MENVVKSHPVADEYALLSENEYRDLVEDIRKRGLLIPIVVDTDGAIIDGRHRWRACEEIGIKCRKVTFVGTDEEKRAHAKSLNVYRRHLTESQRGMAAAKTVNVVNGTNQHTKKEGVPRGIPSKTVTIEDASRKAKVSRRTVARAVKVLKEGTPELVKAVEDAVVTVAVAEKILKLPIEQQAAAIETGVVKPTEKPLSEQFAEALEPLMKKLESLETGSEEAIKISELLAKASAKASSKACDMSPVQQPDVKPKGRLFDDEPEAKPIPGRMNPTNADFERFWKEYPRKVNKQNAKTAFEKAFRRLRFAHDAESAIEVILKGVRIYSARANPEALCHPTTWLNGSRWEDDPDSIGTPSLADSKMASRLKAARHGTYDESEEILDPQEARRRAML